jgi:leader peptidase (prepilin peptidase)/N-methyltransferase
MVPVGWTLAALGYLPISLYESIIGSLAGYLMLWTIRTLFYLVTKKDGMGEGDLELLCLVGAFTGVAGAWSAMVIGSALGAVVSMIYLMSTRQSYTTPLPFGPFLALGAIIQVLFPYNPLIAFLF